MTCTYFGLAALAALTIAAPSQAAVIDFGNLDTSGPFGGNGAAFTTYSEDGFTVSAPVGQYVQATTFNGSAPSSVPALLTGQFNTVPNAALTITNGSTFSFGSVDFFSAQQLIAAFNVAGYLGNNIIFSTTGTLIPRGASTYTNSNAGLIDRLVINTQSDGQLYIDNIKVTAAAVAAVPEPATWAMMIVGFGMAGAAMRRRKRQTVAYA